MKKLAVLLGFVGMLMLAVSMAQAQSDWAYYKENPLKVCLPDGFCYVADGYIGPRLYTEPEIVDGTNPKYVDYPNGTELYYLDCCACHGPDAPGNHGGPKNLQCP